MTHTLTIAFIGLIAFVQAPLGGYFGLFVDARRPVAEQPRCLARALDNEGNVAYPAHQPALVLRTDDIYELSEGCRDLVEDPVVLGVCDLPECATLPRCRVSVVSLDGHEIEIIRPVDKNGLFQRGGRPADVDRSPHFVPRTKEEARDFAWLPQMSSVSEDRAEVRSACLGSNPTSGGSCPVVGRFKIGSGDLFTEYLEPRVNPECTIGQVRKHVPFVTYDFVEFNQVGDPYTTFGSSVAEGIASEITIPLGEAPMIRMRKFGELEAACDITLMVNRNIQMFALNVVGADDLETNYLCNMEVRPDADMLPHYGAFQEFYKLSKTATLELECPVPRPVCVHAGSPRCPLVEMED